MTQLDGKSMDIVNENIEKLKEIFPEAFSEDKIDFEKLQEELGNFTDKENERYNFTWAGKNEAKKIAQTQSTGTLRPCREESKDWDTTQNLYIEGDNLEVLKLLQKSYHKQVKMIYIDPPYNTGKDFVYKDNFRDNIKNYMEITGQVDSEGNRLSTNSDTNGRYHSDWLNMMYPRLKLARNLLKDDGVIFISIDDNEVANLRKICDEIFGEDNFLANVAWKHTQQSKNDEPYFSRQYNALVIYRKSQALEKLRLPRSEKDNKNYSNPDNDINGKWRSGDVRSPSYRKTLCFDIETPSGKIIKAPGNGWRWSEEEVKKKIVSGEIIFNKEEDKIIRKIYLKNQDGRTPENIWIGDDFGTTRNANAEMKELFDGFTPFDTPKPSQLIYKVFQLFKDDKELLCLDFFSGSGTTAHATMRINFEDDGNRRYICVQLPEETDEKSEAYKAGYKNICEIGKERIRRAGEKINGELRVENGELADKLDIGFKVLKLDSSNIKEWDSDFEGLEENLLESVDNIKDERTSEDLLYEILLKYGLDLTLPIEEKTINDKTVYVIGFGALVVCLDNDIDIQTVESIAKLKSEYETEIMRVVFKDSSFKDAVVKTNAIQVLKQYEIDEVVSI